MPWWVRAARESVHGVLPAAQVSVPSATVGRAHGHQRPAAALVQQLLQRGLPTCMLQSTWARAGSSGPCAGHPRQASQLPNNSSTPACLHTEHVGKSLEEVRGHFLATYIEHDNAPLPRREPAMQGVSLCCGGMGQGAAGQARVCGGCFAVTAWNN